jgi:hypothetical protein
MCELIGILLCLTEIKSQYISGLVLRAMLLSQYPEGDSETQEQLS